MAILTQLQKHAAALDEEYRRVMVAIETIQALRPDTQKTVAQAVNGAVKTRKPMPVKQRRLMSRLMKRRWKAFRAAKKTTTKTAAK